MSEFPDTRLRRLREQPSIRSLVRETRLTTSSFVYPMFIRHGSGIKETIDPMPGCFHISLDLLAEEVQEVYDLGIPAVLLFGLPAYKDPLGTEAYDPEGIIQEAIRIIKKATPDLMVIGDVCLCEYTDHGHCGVINDNQVDNDQTLALLGKTGLAQIPAGGKHWMHLDIAIGPSWDMLQSTLLHSMGRSVLQQTPLLNSAIAGHTKWIQQTQEWQCEKSRQIYLKARI